MKAKIKAKKGFIQVPLLIGIVVSIITATGIGYGAIEYSKTSKIIREAEQLTKEEKYDEAIAKLEPAQNKLFGKMIFKQKISTELDTNKKLLEDKSEYTQGIEEFNKENWYKAIELLSKVSETLNNKSFACSQFPLLNSPNPWVYSDLSSSSFLFMSNSVLIFCLNIILPKNLF